MVYTYQRRRAMNKMARTLFPDIEFQEEKDGVPVMTCSVLPPTARRIEPEENFPDLLMELCEKKDEMGRKITDKAKYLVVFVKSTRIEGQTTTTYYRVNYVSPATCSIDIACRYIAEGKLYAVIPQSHER